MATMWRIFLADFVYFRAMYGAETDDDNVSSISSANTALASKQEEIPTLIEKQPELDIPPAIQPRISTKNLSKDEEKKEIMENTKIMPKMTLNSTASEIPEATNENKNEATEIQVEGGRFVAIHGYKAEDSEDLDVEIGQEFTLLATRSDGWWRCMNSEGGIGLVPKNVLQHLANSEVQSVDENHELSLNSEPNHQRRHSTKVFKSASNVQTDNLQPQKRDSLPNFPVDFQLQKFVKDDHFGLICHLFPRLSESNLHFHDVFWIWNPTEKCYKIRKRKVKFCKLFKIHGIVPSEFRQSLNAKFYLFDRRNTVGRQIVSNILTSFVPTESFSFFKNENCTLICRSNYNLPEVVLKIELFQQNNFVGFAEIALLSSNHEVIRNNRLTIPIQRENGGTTNFKLNLQIQDIPNSLISDVDGLPDVLLCQENMVTILASYRNLLADYLGHCTSPTTWISDPVIATFPTAISDADLMKLLIDELDKQKNNSSATFRKLYIDTILPLVVSSPIPEDQNLKNRMMASYTAMLQKNKSAIEYLSMSRSRPVNPFEYVVDLTSIHALD